MRWESNTKQKDPFKGWPILHQYMQYIYQVTFTYVLAGRLLNID